MLRSFNEYWVKIHHVPTGIITVCRAYRSQHKNRDSAWNRLRSLIYARLKGINPNKEVVKSYTLPDSEEYPDDLSKYERKIK